MTLKIGDRLWYVPGNRNGSPRHVTVLSVGRKWADIGGGTRISIETLKADGGKYTSPGTCYPSKEEYEAEQALDRAWRRFENMVRYSSCPAGIRMSQIENAARALFGKSVLEQPQPGAEKP